MKKVTKEKFEEFIKNYDGSGELYSHNIKLSKTFDHVQFTNSYKDWKKDWEGQPTSFPKNVTQIDVV